VTSHWSDFIPHLHGEHPANKPKMPAHPAMARQKMSAICPASIIITSFIPIFNKFISGIAFAVFHKKHRDAYAPLCSVKR
jgi:hypothetical protein